ncbi:hypothetical protein L596_014913 [Steinernema carpocapsae]|uniref:Rad21/Rec8-like protein N-terminal domain-containing protein n=1 Tax=Steinernema carpocapsae TaxID=34508 RepID=A0A4V6A2Y7_STECR|nr:hypothetical protein L596_014913 [Steinernema carpocapsae]
MFYAQFVLSKKGPMAKIWLAAHWEKKLTKAQIYETNVQEAVGEIMEPKAKMALRTTGHLLLGIVRIYSRKAKYLLADCNEAFLKIKMAFRPGNMDRLDDDDDMETSKVALTLPEVIPEMDSVLPDFSDYDYKLQINQSRIDEITLKEDLITDIREPMIDDDFGMDDFGEKEFACFGDDDDNFGEVPRAEGSSYISHTPFHTMSTDYSNGDLLHSRDDDFGGPSTTLPEDDFGDFADAGDPMLDDELFTDNDIAKRFANIEAPGGEADELLMDTFEAPPVAATPTPSVIGSTMSLSTAPEITLDPLDTSALQPPEKTAKTRRRRKLLIDEVRNITGDEMKHNMANYIDITQTVDLAPPSKRAMKQKENSQCDQLMTTPGCSFLYNKSVRAVYHAQLVLGVRDDDEAPKEDEEGGDFDLRRDLDMLENVDDDFGTLASEPFDDFDPSPAPGSPTLEFNETTLEEPMEGEAASGGLSPRPESPSEKPKKRSKSEKNVEEEDDAEDDSGHRWTRQTRTVLKTLATKLKSHEEINFNDILTKGVTVKSAAQKFYALLELKKSQAINFSQDEPFDEIRIVTGANMSSFVN